MKNINEVTLTGTLGADAEFRVTQGGDEVLNFRMAHTRSRFDKDRNEWVDLNTTWWNVALWDKSAQLLADELSKGQRVIVTGSVEMREYERKDGTTGTSPDLRATAVAITPRAGSAQHRGGGNQQSSGGFGAGNANNAYSPQQNTASNGGFGGNDTPPF